MFCLEMLKERIDARKAVDMCAVATNKGLPRSTDMDTQGTSIQEQSFFFIVKMF